MRARLRGDIIKACLVHFVGCEYDVLAKAVKLRENVNNALECIRMVIRNSDRHEK